MALDRPGRRRRISQRAVAPQAIYPGKMSQDILKNNFSGSATFSFNDGATATLSVRVKSVIREDVRLAPAPFFLTVFQASSLSEIAPGTNQVPFDVTYNDYTLQGPYAMPIYEVDSKRYNTSSTSGGRVYFATGENDYVYKFSITNNTGGSKSMVILFGSRVVQGIGGGGTD